MATITFLKGRSNLKSYKNLELWSFEKVKKTSKFKINNKNICNTRRSYVLKTGNSNFKNLKIFFKYDVLYELDPKGS